MKQEDQTQPEWLKESLDPGAVVGFDPYLFTATGMVQQLNLSFFFEFTKNTKMMEYIPSSATFSVRCP